MGKENGELLKEIKSLEKENYRLKNTVLDLKEKNLKLTQQKINLSDQLKECRKNLKSPASIEDYLKKIMDEEKRVQKEKPNK